MSAPSKTDAKKDQLIGDAKDTVGTMVGNESLQAKGQAQHNEGVVQETAANISGFVQGLSDQVQGTVTGAYNALTGNTTGEVTSKAEKKSGEAQKAVNS
ncbi:hypothetical protein J3Q64DRAFT_1730717 [Phycomyces blakesleeanus]|uniref:CsbD-like domain-containing protein n=2 Tax=Phycomyces blakesleeanus TaxID=4837 RepID=A0A162U883_PHYB8|nr:hypothetical protein PHYBLDRAFT_124492 [Phycomyces blakesleeanus NRRL 1555(-)]OAD74252.1 hypothetical protein PHYBLDRAFT_124492 [Phycomyces blakesleeanus NRRL 1555(-)]|eukprot:XP_018292292.1 hypothetical protein PHYBLDRAFT_124492 [Phycomyces blakesleeanus NRRL 1555(-)]